MIDYWFPTPVYSFQLDEFKIHNSYLVGKAYELKNKHQKSTDWHCDTYNTLNISDSAEKQDEIILKLIDSCLNHVAIFAGLFGVDQNKNIVCCDFWFNIAAPENFQEQHQHLGNNFSLVYYVKVPDVSKSGNIRFRSMKSLSSIPLPISKLTDLTYATCDYAPIESKILIFESNLIHCVDKNLSNDDRISISMNFKY